MKLSSALPVVGGYLFTYYHARISDERKAQIDRINDQLRQLYGPLLACVTASASAYDAMVRQHSPDGTRATLVKAIQEHPNGPQGDAYRDWMRVVFQPLNERASRIIEDHLDLLDSDQVEPLLLQLVAHVSAYKVVMQSWTEGNTAAWSSVTYPNKLPEYAQSEFKRLKARQAKLLGLKPLTSNAKPVVAQAKL